MLADVRRAASESNALLLTVLPYFDHEDIPAAGGAFQADLYLVIVDIHSASGQFPVHCGRCEHAVSKTIEMSAYSTP